MADSEQVRDWLLLLLRAVLCGETAPLPPPDVLPALTAAQRHGLTVMVFHGLTAAGMPVTAPAMQPLYAAFVQAINAFEGQERELRALFAALEQADIAYLPLKGAVLRKYIRSRNFARWGTRIS